MGREDLRLQGLLKDSSMKDPTQEKHIP